MWIVRLRRVQERGQFFPHRSDAPRFRDGVGGPHPLPWLEVEEQPTLQFTPRRDQMGMVRQVVRHGQDAVVQEPVVVRGVRTPLEPQVQLVALARQEGLSFAGQLAPGGQRSQVLVGDAQRAGPRQHLDFDAVPQTTCVHAGRPRAGIAGRRPVARTPHVADLSMDAIDDRFRQLQVGLDGADESLLLDQPPAAVGPHAERLERRTAGRGIECIPDGPARAEPGKQPQRVQEIALAGRVRSEQHRERCQLHLDVSQRLVALDVNTPQHPPSLHVLVVIDRNCAPVPTS